MKKLLQNVALLSSVALLTLGTGQPVLAASPSPSSAPSPKTGTSTPTPKAVGNSALPSALPASAPKAGVAPKAAPRFVTKAGLAAAAVTAPSASLPATNCASTCGLFATDGTITVPGMLEPLDIWGFATTTAVAHNASAPGPTLIFNENDSITIRLTNNLPSPAGVTLPATPTCPDDPRCISLELPAVSLLPDRVGVAFGASKNYSIGRLAPGTYIYQAGPTPHAQRQLRMGLSGLLIVRPKAFAPGLLSGAYDGPTVGTVDGVFTAESVAALNEFDPEFNKSPFVADPVDYNASVFTLNGHAFDPSGLGAGKIDVGNTDTILMRYANLGSHDRGLTILNHRQQVLAEDSNRLKNPGDVATKWLTAGQVSDAFVKIDPQSPLGSRIPIFESGYHLNNGDSLGLGGAMNYLDVVSGVAGAASGPISTVAIGASTYTDTQPLTFTATVTTTTAPLSGAEWFFDGVGAAGSGFKFSDTAHATCPAGTVIGATTTFNCSMTPAQVNALVVLAPPADGDHLIWVHGLDAGGWGVVSGDVFTFNGSGPVIGSVTSHAAVTCDASIPACAATNGYSAMTTHANVAPATGTSTGFPVYTNVANGASNTHVVNNQRVPCTVADVAAVPSVGCTAVGDNVINKDLVLLGTAASSLSDWVVLGGEYCLDPAPNPLDPSTCSLAGSAVSAMKLITTPGPTTGAGTVPSPTVYSGPNVPDPCVPLPSPAGVNPPALGAAPGGGSVVSFCATVPQATLATLAEGTHYLYIHAYETPSAPTAGFTAKAGRWGPYDPTSPVTFVIDRTGPSAGTPVIDHNPNNGTVFSAGNLNFLDSLQVAATLDDSKAGYGNSIVNSGEVFLSKDDGRLTPVPAAEYGTGAEMVPTGGQWNSSTKLAYAYIPLAELTSYPEGKVKFWVHGRDLAGNWGEWSSVLLTLDRTAPTITSTSSAIGSVTFTATDPLSGGVQSKIVQAEWFTAFPDPGVGLGNPINIPTPGFTVTGVTFQPVAASGTQIFFRVKDQAGNWSTTSMVVAK